MITQLHASYMRRAAASSCAMRMHLVLQNTGEQRPRSRAGMSFRYSFALIRLGYWLARGTAGWTKRAFLSPHPAYLGFSVHSVHRVECRWAAPNHLKYSLCLCRTRPREEARCPSFLNYRVMRVRSLRLNANRI